MGPDVLELLPASAIRPVIITAVAIAIAVAVAVGERAEVVHLGQQTLDIIVGELAELPVLQGHLANVWSVPQRPIEQSPTLLRGWWEQRLGLLQPLDAGSMCLL